MHRILARSPLTVGAKVIIVFMVAISLSFLTMITVQVHGQRDSLIEIVTGNVAERAHQLAAAVKIGVLANNDSAILAEYKPLADAEGSQLSGIAAFDETGASILSVNEKEVPFDLTEAPARAPNVLAKGESVVLAFSDHIVVVCPVESIRGDRIIGAIATAWNLDRENAAVAGALRKQIVVALVAMLALIAVLAGLLRLLVICPLVRMTGAMDRLAQGDMEISVPEIERRDELGRMASAVEIFKKNAVALRQSEARYRDLLDNLIEGVYQAQPGGTLIGVNRAMAEFFGYPSAEDMVKTAGGAADTFYADPRDYARMMEDLVRNGFVHGFEAPARRRDGSEWEAVWNVKAVCNEAGEMIRIDGTVADITARKVAEMEILKLNVQLEDRVQRRTAELRTTLENLRRTQEELIQTEKLAGLGSLVAGIAHEINTPLGAGVTVASTLQEKIGRFQILVDQGALRRSTINEFLSDLATATSLLNTSLHKAAELIGNFKRVAVDQTSDQRRVFDCRTVVEEVVSMLRPMTKHRAIDFVIAIPEGLAVDSYPGAFGQIITNLTTNALVHGFDGRETGTIRIEAERQEVAEGAWLRLAFSDDGCGIPSDNRSRIFDPFFTTKLGKGGSGLGLHIVFSLVTQVLRGKVSLTDEKGIGTTFVISFPISLA